MRRRGRWRRPRNIILAILAALIAAWVIIGYFVIVDPDVNKPSRADAIVLLGPPQADGRLAVTRRLLAEGMAPNLLVSLNSPKQRAAAALCAHPPEGVTAVCFHADPQTTRGEAEATERFVRAHGWHKIIVVTSTYHISRARLLFRRCFDGKLLMVAADHGISFGKWVYEYFYQTGAYVKAAFESGC